MRPMPAEVSIDDHLSLRQLTSDNAEDLFQIIKDDPEIGQNVTWPAGIHSLEDTRRAIEQLLSEDKTPYVLQENGETIGFAGAWYPEDRQHEVGLSYFLAKDKRGHGFVTRTVQGLMQAATDSMPVDTFVANIIDGNGPSIAIIEKLGFKRTDELKYDEALQAQIRRYERPAHD